MTPLREEQSTSLKRGAVAWTLAFGVSMLYAIVADGLDVEWVREAARGALVGLSATGLLAAYGVADALRNDAKPGP